MDHETIRLVQESFRQVAPIADKVGATFYARLFETHPTLRPLFAEDVRPQAEKFMEMLSMIIDSLQEFYTILLTVDDLARRHKGYGVVEADYTVMGDTLMWALEQTLCDAFTPQVKRAWLKVYEALASVMLAAAKDPVALRS